MYLTSIYIPIRRGGRQERIFVALFDYDPPTMSPNPEACDEELPFREGQLIKVSFFMFLFNLELEFLNKKSQSQVHLQLIVFFMGFSILKLVFG